MSYAAMAYYMAGMTPPEASVVYGPPAPVEMPPPWYLQCGRCGAPVLGKNPRAATPADAHNIKDCPGPFPLDFPDCPGPFFDAAAPVGLQDHCCICLLPCEIDEDKLDQVMPKGADITAIPFDRNVNQLLFHHMVR